MTGLIVLGVVRLLFSQCSLFFKNKNGQSYVPAAAGGSKNLHIGNYMDFKFQLPRVWICYIRDFTHYNLLIFTHILTFVDKKLKGNITQNGFVI